MLLTHSSVGLLSVQLWQVSSSSTPAPTSIVLTVASRVHASVLGSHASSDPHPTTPSTHDSDAMTRPFMGGR